jgi:hypothetical protein
MRALLFWGCRGQEKLDLGFATTSNAAISI